MIGLRRLCVVAALLAALLAAASAETKVQHKVKCLEDAMIVEIVKQPDMLDIYPEGLRSFPDPNCHPLVADGLAVLRLDLTEKFECGITKVTNQITRAQGELREEAAHCFTSPLIVEHPQCGLF
ncbi:uncharacterized protein LOC127749360 [Frankliniella occidentalis]|uniref:Uncharacterized protein LOC127749360 n=1 Tax=Frankliniella occidentalis TaxID=133901 RepID=A0A9C6WVR6_FRAOC|nr:uncharacterized protein LOC127749360 [Frankliniella occidentalis]